ncbi:hypothetical protein [Bacillus sp. FJAT-27264]|nr:hypothetical protein [Bacillus sp. FJAT-27264]
MKVGYVRGGRINFDCGYGLSKSSESDIMQTFHKIKNCRMG